MWKNIEFMRDSTTYILYLDDISSLESNAQDMARDILSELQARAARFAPQASKSEVHLLMKSMKS